jgi:hypothetical protein
VVSSLQIGASLCASAGPASYRPVLYPGIIEVGAHRAAGVENLCRWGSTFLLNGDADKSFVFFSAVETGNGQNLMGQDHLLRCNAAEPELRGALSDRRDRFSGYADSVQASS